MPPRTPTILPALRTLLDFSLVHALRARRAGREPHAPHKLALLRRLAQQTLFHTLPETRVEQSWNEQLFAKVLGYRTLLSHDARPFHILPKNITNHRRYDDFSLGFFGAGDDLVLGTAELKSPGASLDASQNSPQYGGATPVEQALAAARSHDGTCRWVLVSNFRELRLYDLRDPGDPLAVVTDLSTIRSRDDLALVCAHFDCAALLGEAGKDNAEMPAALAADHPSHPLPAQAGHARLVLRFVRKDESTLPLFRVEKALREAAEAIGADIDPTTTIRDWEFSTKDGWVVTTPLPTLRLAASRFGELQLSLAIPAPPELLPLDGQSSMWAKVPSRSLHAGMLAFCKAITAFQRSHSGGTPLTGVVGGELREVKDVMLQIESMGESGAPSVGVCPAPDIATGDFECSGDLFSPAASCLCELAVQFRAKRGGVALSHHGVRTWLVRILTTSSESP